MDRSNTHNSFILVLNSGSSSLKFNLYHQDSLDLEVLLSKNTHCDNLETAAAELINWLESFTDRFPIKSLGYRLVQGGPLHKIPEIITEDLIEVLQTYIYLAPNHLPDEIQLIRIFRQSFKDSIHIACFDTFFHQNMPTIAKFYALPLEYRDQGLMRYGFHGLSYEYILQELYKENQGIDEKKIIIAHLGNGASMVAVSGGIGRETTMGMSPMGGLVMSTRSGDLDPGVILFLLRHHPMTPEQLDELLSKESGLKAIADTGNMEQLIEDRSSDSRAQEAIDVFCYQAKKQIAALAAGLGGLDMLIFSGGIGENAPLIREQICMDMGFIGIKLDPILNKEGNSSISASDSTVRVQVIKTNEAWMIANHVRYITNTYKKAKL